MSASVYGLGDLRGFSGERTMACNYWRQALDLAVELQLDELSNSLRVQLSTHGCGDEGVE
ncbi:MAG: hypothetical protein GY796_24080 [Chloroflexi bacterium]|nr:hypothetical protein [Chloroflexota bacterium]